MLHNKILVFLWVKISVLWRQDEIIINTSDQFSHLQMSPLHPLFRSTCLLQVTMMTSPAKTWKQEVQYFFSKMENFVKIKETKWDLNSTREGALLPVILFLLLCLQDRVLSTLLEGCLCSPLAEAVGYDLNDCVKSSWRKIHQILKIQRGCRLSRPDC